MRDVLQSAWHRLDRGSRACRESHLSGRGYDWSTPSFFKAFGDILAVNGPSAAHFLLGEGTGEAKIRPSSSHFGSIFSVENRAGALSRPRLLKEEERSGI